METNARKNQIKRHGQQQRVRKQEATPDKSANHLAYFLNCFLFYFIFFKYFPHRDAQSSEIMIAVCGGLSGARRR